MPTAKSATSNDESTFLRVVDSPTEPVVEATDSAAPDPSAPSASSPPRPQHPREPLHGVNLIRVLLTVWIFYFHFQVFFPNASQYSPNYTTNGGFAVELFFIISGFVLTFVYLDAFKRDRNFKLEAAKFLAKRFIRIWPVHVLTTYLFHVLTPDCPLDELLNQITLRTYRSTDSILKCNVPAWFVHQELYLCLALPFVLWLLNRHRAGVLAVAALACGSWAVYVKYAFPVWDESFQQAVLRAIPSFTTGVLLGWVYNKNKSVSCWFDVAALALTLQFFRVLEGPVLGQEQFLLRTVLLFLPLLYCVSRGKLIDFLANTSFLRVASNLCFTFFMFQWLVLDAGKRTAFGLEPNFIYKSFKYVWPSLALFTLAWAAVVHYSVEEKLTQAADLLCKWLDRRQTRPQPEPASQTPLS